jgi:hypothetical protein
VLICGICGQTYTQDALTQSTNEIFGNIIIICNFATQIINLKLKDMKKVAMILGIVGGSLGFIGGVFQTLFGAVGSALDAQGADEVGVMGIFALVFSLVALIISCVIEKNTKVIAFAVLALGIVCIILGNYFSGIIIVAAGIVGLISLKTNDVPKA